MNKIKIAKNQLEDAIELFLDKKSYASATTLAGAAEEVLGTELENQGKSNALTWQWTMQKTIYKLFNDGPNIRKDFNNESNKVRNTLKHYSEDELNPEDIEEAAIKMIVRANENAARLQIEISRIEEFEEWFYIHVIGY